MTDQKELLQKKITSFLADDGLELFDFKIKMRQGVADVELFIDRPNGGISLEECAKINREINTFIEEEGFYGDDYTVSVSSPGLDWPLKTMRDFQRVIGFDVEVQLDSEDVKKILKQKGTLVSVDEQTVVLETSKGRVKVLLENIKQAILMI